MMNVRNGMQRALNKVSKLISNADQPTLVVVVLVIVLIFTIVWKLFFKKFSLCSNNHCKLAILYWHSSFLFLSCTS